MEKLILDLNWLIFIVKIILAIGCGFAIGIERETMGKPAGIKTHTLICLGSCLFTHFSISTADGDPTRIAAQVVSGIGFIGAGTILQSKRHIEGLTSAALVFVNAAIGMLIGGNYFLYSIISTISLLILFQFLRKNKFQSKVQPYRIQIRCKNYNQIKEIISFFHHLNCKITSKKVDKTNRILELTLTYSTSPLANHRIISKLTSLNSIDGFTQI